MCDVHSPFWRQETRRARLVHRCDECGFPIMRGERYVCTSGKWDGEFEMYRAHELCELLAASLQDDDGCRMVGNLIYWDGPFMPLQARWWSSLMALPAPAAEDA